MAGAEVVVGVGLISPEVQMIIVNAGGDDDNDVECEYWWRRELCPLHNARGDDKKFEVWM
jgi:hypothetical protein